MAPTFFTGPYVVYAAVWLPNLNLHVVASVASCGPSGNYERSDPFVDPRAFLFALEHTIGAAPTVLSTCVGTGRSQFLQVVDRTQLCVTPLGILVSQQKFQYRFICCQARNARSES